jgi:glutamate/tyrosine decarboxylase-like PLP-dependent enzyme
MADPDAAPSFPAHGRSADDLLAQIGGMREGDADWRGGRTFSLVYNTDDEGLEHVLHEVGAAYLHENALNPFAFPSLLRMEQEIVAMAADPFHGDPRAGSISSGGTESIFLAVQTARDHARDERGIAAPTLVCAETAHPAFAKACKYLDVEQIQVPIGPEKRADVAAMAAAIDDRTALLVGSAPCYPFGVIDPITDIAALALDRGLLCHVDACLGGWLLPFWERLGEPVVPWDLAVEGVTSLSADVHKYGYTFKGLSTVMYRDRALLKRQHFIYDRWPGGLYGSATAAGTRPAAPIAGAWAALNYLGIDGYLRLAGRVRDATRRFAAGIEDIDGLHLSAAPDLSVFEFGSDTYDIDAIGDVMDDRGWHLDRQQGGLHIMVFPGHDQVVDQFLDDLAAAVDQHGESRGEDAVYGSIA